MEFIKRQIISSRFLPPPPLVFLFFTPQVPSFSSSSPLLFLCLSFSGSIFCSPYLSPTLYPPLSPFSLSLSLSHPHSPSPSFPHSISLLSPFSLPLFTYSLSPSYPHSLSSLSPLSLPLITYSLSPSCLYCTV